MRIGAFSYPCAASVGAFVNGLVVVIAAHIVGAQQAGKQLKKVVLELGGNAAVIVDKDADLEDALERIIFGAFYQSGQSCIGVQRILIHADVYDAFKPMLVEKTKTLVAGDPKDPDVFIGPTISEGEATRLKGWIDDSI